MSWRGENALFEGDILLNLYEDGTAGFTKERPDAFTKGAGWSNVDIFWPGNTVYYTIDSGLSNQSRVTDAISHWQSKTNVRFVNSSSAPNRILFKYDSSSCSSAVGMSGGEQTIKVANGCTKGNMIHEIGHAVGLWHEHTREDRDQYMTINWSKIESGKSHNFDIYSDRVCSYDSSGNGIDCDGEDYGAIDPSSIMMYPCDAFASGGNTISPVDSGWCDDMGQRSGLSSEDVRGLAEMYPPVLYAVQEDPCGSLAFPRLGAPTAQAAGRRVSPLGVSALGNAARDLDVASSGQAPPRAESPV